MLDKINVHEDYFQNSRCSRRSSGSRAIDRSFNHSHIGIIPRSRSMTRATTTRKSNKDTSLHHNQPQASTQHLMRNDRFPETAINKEAQQLIIIHPEVSSDDTMSSLIDMHYNDECNGRNRTPDKHWATILVELLEACAFVPA